MIINLISVANKYYYEDNYETKILNYIERCRNKFNEHDVYIETIFQEAIRITI